MRTLLYIVLWALITTPNMSHAGYHQIDMDEVVQAELLHGWSTQNGTHMSAVRIRLAPGWKTYWRSPGDAGIPPSFDWRRSKNLKSVRYHWPVPDVFVDNGMRSIGYAHELVLPIELTPVNSGIDMLLKAQIEIGVCEDICIPASLRISGKISGQGSSDARIKAAINARPDTMSEAGIRDVRCQVEPIADGLRITTQIDMPRIAAKEVAIVELPDPRIWVSEPMVKREGRRLIAVADMVPPNSRPFALDRSSVRITIIGNGRAVDIRGCKG